MAVKLRPGEHPMTIEVATIALDAMREFRYFPKNQMLVDLVRNEVFRMCPSAESASWLVNRCYELWNGEWKGPKELRAVLCAKYPPADGKDAISEIWDDGIVPPESPLPEAPAVPLLPPGRAVSADESMDKLVTGIDKRLRVVKRGER